MSSKLVACFLFSCSIFFSWDAQAQEIVANLPLNVSGKAKAYCTTDTRGRFCVATLDEDELSLSILQTNLSPYKQIKQRLPKDLRIDQVFGWHMTNNRLHLYIAKKDSFNLYRLTLHTVKESLSTHKIDWRINGAKFLYAFTSANGFCILHAEASKKELHLGHVDQELGFTKHVFTVDGFYEHAALFLKKPSQLDIGFIDSRTPQQFKNSLYPIKLYEVGNLIYLSVDKTYSTRLITLNLSDDSAISKDYSVFLDKGAISTGAKSNSLIYKGNLYQAVTGPRNFCIQVSSITSGETLYNGCSPLHKSGNIPITDLHVQSAKMNEDIKRHVDFSSWERALSKSELGLSINYHNETSVALNIGLAKFGKREFKQAMLSTSPTKDHIALEDGKLDICGTYQSPEYNRSLIWKNSTSKYFGCILDISTWQMAPNLNLSLLAIDEAWGNSYFVQLSNHGVLVQAPSAHYFKGSYFLGFFQKRKSSYTLVKHVDE